MERRMIQVESVGTSKPLGKGVKTEFKGGDGVVYEYWAPEMDSYIKKGATIDAEVDYSQKQSGSQTYHHYKITKLFDPSGKVLVEDRPPGKGGFAGGGSKWQPKDPAEAAMERRSIESQTAFNGIIALAKEEIAGTGGVNPTMAPLLTKALKWAEARLDDTMTPWKVVAPKASPATTQPPTGSAETQKTASTPPKQSNPPTEGFGNAGMFLKKSLEQYGYNRSQVLSFPKVAELFDANRFEEAWKRLEIEVKALVTATSK